MKIAILVSALSVFVASSVFANGEEIIGSFKNTDDGSFINKLATELFKESSDKEDRFEDLDLELSLDFTDFLKANLKYSRRINIANPSLSENAEVGLYDYAKYRSSNSITSRIELTPEWLDYVGTLAEAGVYFGISNTKMPRHSELGLPTTKTELREICEAAQAWIPVLTEEYRKDLSSFNCSDKLKGFSGAFERFVKALNSPVRSLLQNHFSDSEKMDAYSDQSFEALTNYTRYGFPVDLGSFYDSNKILSVGDIVQQSVFYKVDPVRIGGKIDFGFRVGISPKSFRALRDTRIQKLGNNKVALQITDYFAKGEEYEFLKLRPKLLWILNYTFANWKRNTFNSEILRRNYEVDLSYSEGVKFLREVLNKGYYVNIELDRNSDLDEIELPEGVKAQPRLFLKEEKSDAIQRARFPGIFDYLSRSNVDIKDASIGKERQQVSLDMQYVERRKFDLGFWFIKDVNRSTSCQFNTSTYGNPVAEHDTRVLISDKLAMNLDCMYTDRYVDQDLLFRIIDTNKMLFETPYDNEFRYRLSNLNSKNLGSLEYGFNLSLNWEHLDNVVSNLSEDKLYYELVEILFGIEYRKIWEKAGVRRVMHDIRVNKNMRGLYDHLLTMYTPLDCTAATMDGRVKAGLGLEEMNLLERQCSEVVLKFLKRIAVHLKEVRTAKDIKDRFSEVARAYPTQSTTILLGVLLQNLAEPTEENPVHYSFSVNADKLLGPIEYSNGPAFRVSHESTQDPIVDVNEIKDVGVRLTNAVLRKPITGSNPTVLNLDVYTTHKFNTDTVLEVEVREFEVLKDDNKSKIDRDLTRPRQVVELVASNKEILGIPGGTNGAKYVYENIKIPVDKSWKKGRKHVMLLRMKNLDGEWISEEAEFGFNW